MTASAPSETKHPHRSLKRDLGPVGLLFAGVGSIIGSGWLFGALTAAQLAGPAAIYSWIIAAVMILLIGLTYGELGTMFPLSGGVVRFPHLSFGSFASFTMGWITWVAAATVAPIEVEAALQYGTKYAPFTVSHMLNGEEVHTLTALGYGVAVIGMAVFVVINYYGIRWFARINNALVVWKLFMILLVIVVFALTQFHTANFSDYGFQPTGWHGVFTAIATGGITFSYLGFRQGVELAGETSNPKRNVPLAIVGSVLITAVIYVALQIAFLGAVAPADLAKSGGWEKLNFASDFGPLAAIATILGLGWLAVLLYIDAVISPADTGLIYMTVTARLSYAMARNENAPESLAKTTDRGVPFVSLIVAFVVGLIVLLPFPSWQQLVGFITSATVLSFASGPLVLAAMRRQLPDEARSFRLPGGDVIPFLAFYASNLVVYWAGWLVNWKLFVTIILGLVLLAVFETVNKKDRGLDLRSGATWLLPWLAGLALISWLGDYPEHGEGAGNLGVIGLGWGFVVLLALSAVIYVLALSSRLAPEDCRANVEESRDEAASEDATLAG